MSEHSAPAAPIAIVVMSYGIRRTLAASVRSALQQDVPAEVIVVHSGDGEVGAYLREHHIDVPVICSPQRLLPGAARNRGIDATTAPYVAFLADDCFAAPDWGRERVRLHEGGAASVASALLCHKPADPLAHAAHVSLFVRRMPRASPDVALRYGGSYRRDVFDRYGRFREDIESGEDTEFHQRLSEIDKPIWAPTVRTTHAGAEKLGDFISGQFKRGQRMARAWTALGQFSRRQVARNAIDRTTLIVRESLQVVEPRHRLVAILGVPFIVLGNIAYAWGALSARA